MMVKGCEGFGAFSGKFHATLFFPLDFGEKTQNLSPLHQLFTLFFVASHP